MADFVMLMKNSHQDGWDVYIDSLVAKGCMRGGSSLGKGICVQNDAEDTACDVTGYIRFEANDLAAARLLLVGNPAYEAGCSIEVLEEIQT